MSEESMHRHDFKTYSLIDLEELHEAVRIEIINRQLRPYKYEVAALRNQVDELTRFVKNNI